MIVKYKRKLFGLASDPPLIRVFINRKLVLVVLPVDVLALGVELEHLHVLVQVATYEPNALSEMGNVHVQSLQEVSEKLVDPHTVVKNQISRLTKVLDELSVDLPLQMPLLLLLQLHPHYQVHGTEHYGRN